MNKIAEKRAKLLFPFQSIEGGEIEAYFNAGQLHKREIYIECYDLIMQDFLEKACEWLNKNQDIYFGTSCIYRKELFEDFKKHMQDEM